MASMPKDSLKDFATLRHSLETERERISARLQSINAVLGDVPSPIVKTSKLAKAKKDTRAKNELSLKKAIIKVTMDKALAKDEIFEAVKNLGYKFTTKKPLNSINVVLYGKKPKFKNQDGKFTST